MELNRQELRDTIARHRMVVSVTVLALVLRLFRLGADPFWADEGRYVTAAARMLRHGHLLARFPGTDVVMSGQPPVFMYLLAVVHALGGGPEWAFRLPSVIAGVLAVPVLYAWLRNHLDGQSLRWSLLAVALSPVLIIYSREAITNMAGLFTQLLAFLACDIWMRSGDRRWIGVTIAASALAIWTHQMNMLLAFLLPLYILVMDDRDWRERLRPAGVTGIPAFVVAMLTHAVLSAHSMSETGATVIRSPSDGLLWPVRYALGVPGYVLGFLDDVTIWSYVDAVRDVFIHFFSRSYLFLPLVGVVLGCSATYRRGERFDRFLVGWLGLVAVMLIVPINALYTAQGLPIVRGAMFLTVPVLLLTVRGFASVADWHGVGRLLMSLLVLVQILHFPLMYTHTVPNDPDRWKWSGQLRERPGLACNGLELAPVFCFPRHPVGYWEGLHWSEAVGLLRQVVPEDVPVYASMAGITQYYAPDHSVRSLLCNVDHRRCDIGVMAVTGERFAVFTDRWRADWQLSRTDRFALERSCQLQNLSYFTLYDCSDVGRRP